MSESIYEERVAYDERVAILPAFERNFIEYFMTRNIWSTLTAVALDEEDPISFLALYRPEPIGAITHFARVVSILQTDGTTEFLLSAAVNVGPIKRVPGAKIQGLKYTTYVNLVTAETYDDL